MRGGIGKGYLAVPYNTATMYVIWMRVFVFRSKSKTEEFHEILNGLLLALYLTCERDSDDILSFLRCVGTKNYHLYTENLGSLDYIPVTVRFVLYDVK